MYILEFGKRKMQRIWAKQKDSGRELVFQCLNDSIPMNLTGCTVTMNMLKPIKVFANAVITEPTTGKIKINITKDMLGIKGVFMADVSVVDAAGKVVSSTNFELDVDSSQRDDTAIIGSNEMNALEAALTKVNNLETNYTPRLNTVESQLADKANSKDVLGLVGNVSNGTPLFASSVSGMTDITRNYVNTSDGLLYAHNGTNWISTGVRYQEMGIADGAVTANKTDFAIIGKNIVEASEYLPDTLLNVNTGATSTVSGFRCSPFKPIEPSTQYTQNKSAVTTFYDINKNFISGSGLAQVTPYAPRTFTTPANAHFYRTAVYNAAMLTDYQIEKGSVSTPYEPAKIEIKNFALKEHSLSQLKMISSFTYAIAGQQITVDWSTKKVSSSSNIVFYYDKTSVTVSPFNLDIPLNTVTYLYIDLTDNTVKIASKVLINNKRLIVLEIYATSTQFFYYTPYRPSVRVINYTGVNLQYIRGGEFFDNTIEESKLSLSLQNKINIAITGNRNFLTLNDAYVAWKNGEKFPIGFFSDSTTDGVGTTGWVGNTLGADSTNVYAYPKILEDKLKQATGNNILRIYNAGFSGKTAEWAITNFDAVFKNTSAYADVKMVGIGFGINDRVLYANQKAFRAGFKTNIKTLIDKCFEANIQPFLLTTQMAISPGVATNMTEYPLRDAMNIETIANEVKKELANTYDLELIDVNYFTDLFVRFSQNSAQAIIPDKLHFSNIGHDYEAQLMFAEINPQTIWIDKKEQIDYSVQRLATGVPENLLSIPPTPSDSFKVFANYTKGDNLDTLIFKVYLFLNTKSLMMLKAYKSDASSLTYVKVDGVTTTLDTMEKLLGNLDLGLHILEVWTGLSNKVDFKGFKVE